VSSDAILMEHALAAARGAAAGDEVPVGAVVVCDGGVIARAENRMRRDHDATAHAELLALRAAHAALGRERLTGCTLYVTLEPCAMCAGAIVWSRVDRVVFGAWDDKAGFGGSVGDLLRHPRLNHRPEVVSGVGAEASAALLREFFAARRG
jgi:tRNA(adenine34) deaminase